MKKILLTFAGLALLVSPLLAATTPTPAPSPTPFPDIIPPQMREVPVNAYLEFDGSTADGATFTSHRTLQALTIPTDYTLYITDINWTCLSEADLDIRWNTASTVPIDSVRFLNTSQGKSTSLVTPKYSVKPGDYPVLGINTSSAGVVYIDGYIK